MKALPLKFFDRDSHIVAQELLGKFLVRKIGTKKVSAMITEVEVYDGFQDLGSHASKGRTPRTEVMYGKPGRFYIYLCYGMYYLLNIITREEGYPAGILIRGVEGHNGPGKLTRYLGINKNLNSLEAIPKNGLWFADGGNTIKKSEIKAEHRIGIDYAGPIWAKKKWRYVLSKSA